MSQSGYTPILIYSSNTATNTPLAANLAAGELAINTADGILFYKDSSNVVQKIGYKLTPTTAGGTGLTSFTNGGIVYASSTSALATGSALTWNGTNLAVTGTLSATGNVTLSGGTANGVAYLNGSKVLTTGSALTFDGTNLVNTSSSVGTPEIAIANSATSAGANARLRLKTGVSGATTLGDAFVQFTDSLNWNWSIGAGSSTSNALTFNQYFGLGSNELMRLTSTGLGIGTSSPSTKLDVVGGSIRINEDSAGTKVLSLRSNYAGLGPAINVTTNDSLLFLTNNTLQATLSASGNLGLGVTPSAWLTSGGTRVLQFAGGSVWSYATDRIAMIQNAYLNSGGNYIYVATDAASHYRLASGVHAWFNAPSGTAGNAITFTQAMTLDASGNLLVGTTSAGAGLGYATRLAVDGGAGEASVFKTSAGTGAYCSRMWNSATSGNNLFVNFQTEASGTDRGSISYNRAGGLVVYNTTSDYRAKDISGPVTNSGALIDSVPVYLGKMKWATEERPMFIAHETPVYAHTGEKDAVDADGKPVYQQMDASALIPVMWAEIQSLRKRLAAAGI